jgi:hypothetical protein
MNPAQGVPGDAELAGIVGDHDDVCHQPVMPERPPSGGFVQRLEQRPVKEVDRAPGQVLPPRHLRAEHFVLELRQLGDHGGLDGLRPQIVQRGLVDDVVLVARPQQRQEVQARFRSAGAEDAKAFAANLESMRFRGQL